MAASAYLFSSPEATPSLRASVSQYLAHEWRKVENRTGEPQRTRVWRRWVAAAEQSMNLKRPRLRSPMVVGEGGLYDVVGRWSRLTDSTSWLGFGRRLCDGTKSSSGLVAALWAPNSCRDGSDRAS